MSKIKNVKDTQKTNKIFPKIVMNAENIVIKTSSLLSLLARIDVDAALKEQIWKDLQAVENYAEGIRDAMFEQCEKKQNGEATK